MKSKTCVEMKVRGVNRRVHIGSQIDGKQKWSAYTYAQGKTVSGIVKLTSAGRRLFYPHGINADLV